MEYLLTIPGTLNNLNDYIAAERTNRHKGAKMKADNGNIVIVAIRQCMRGVRIDNPVFMEYTWVEPNKRRDKDNAEEYEQAEDKSASRWPVLETALSPSWHRN